MVRWKNTDEDDDSWVHEKDFDDIAVIKCYWKQHKLGNIELPKPRGRPRRNASVSAKSMKKKDVHKSGSSISKSGTKKSKNSTTAACNSMTSSLVGGM